MPQKGEGEEGEESEEELPYPPSYKKPAPLGFQRKSTQSRRSIKVNKNYICMVILLVISKWSKHNMFCLD